jgi:hypothetical protein
MGARLNSGRYIVTPNSTQETFFASQFSAKG